MLTFTDSSSLRFDLPLWAIWAITRFMGTNTSCTEGPPAVAAYNRDCRLSVGHISLLGMFTPGCPLFYTFMQRQCC